MCSLKQMLCVRSNSCYVFTQTDAMCSLKPMLCVHSNSCYVFTQTDAMCSLKQMLCVHSNSCQCLLKQLPVFAWLKSSHEVCCSPGNHDWMDCLQNYFRFVCYRKWLGGWLMPQQTSYFATQLPHGWWLFGLDIALTDDIDVAQYAFFHKVSCTPRHSADDS